MLSEVGMGQNMHSHREIRSVVRMDKDGVKNNPGFPCTWFAVVRGPLHPHREDTFAWKAEDAEGD